MKNLLLSASAFVLIMASPIAAQNIQLQSNNSSEIIITANNQKLWDKGNAQESRGLADYEKSRKSLINASSDVVKAQDKIESSDAQSQLLGNEFRSLTSITPDFRTADSAKKWADEVKKIADDWYKNSNRNTDGRKELKKAIKAQTKAQQQVDKAQRMIDEARSMKTQAQQLSRLDR